MQVDDQGSGPAVVMIHGLGGSANTFEAQARALSRSHRVIRPDLPGAGRSQDGAASSLDAWLPCCRHR
jgi:pimeloyl-ACP methyl ester carboxylesterase